MKEITRREFLKASAAGAGLTIAVSVTPFGYRLYAARQEVLPSPRMPGCGSRPGTR